MLQLIKTSKKLFLVFCLAVFSFVATAQVQYVYVSQLTAYAPFTITYNWTELSGTGLTPFTIGEEPPTYGYVFSILNPYGVEISGTRIEGEVSSEAITLPFGGQYLSSEYRFKFTVWNIGDQIAKTLVAPPKAQGLAAEAVVMGYSPGTDNTGSCPTFRINGQAQFYDKKTPCAGGTLWDYYLATKNGTVSLYDFQKALPSNSAGILPCTKTYSPCYTIGLRSWTNYTWNALPQSIQVNSCSAPRLANPATSTNSPTTEFSISPNPFHDEFKMSGYLEKESTVSLEIMNLQGKVVAQPMVNKIISAGEWTETMSLSELPNGIYFYTLRTSDKCISGKIVKAN